MERCGELALGADIQFLFVHMQFYLLTEARSEVRPVAIRDNYQHDFAPSVCVCLIKIGDKLLLEKSMFWLA